MRSSDDRKRPKRKAVTKKSRKIICGRQDWLCLCGCGQKVSWQTKTNTHFDHEPALRLREVNADWTDYIPPQNDPEHIDARCPQSHHVKTRGRGATTAGTDTGKIKKERKRNKAPRFKRPWSQRKTVWPKRSFGRLS